MPRTPKPLFSANAKLTFKEMQRLSCFWASSHHPHKQNSLLNDEFNSSTNELRHLQPWRVPVDIVNAMSILGYG